MAAKAHPEYAHLLQAMKRVATGAQPWEGVTFRSAPPKWSAGVDMIAGVGSKNRGHDSMQRGVLRRCMGARRRNWR